MRERHFWPSKSVFVQAMLTRHGLRNEGVLAEVNDVYFLSVLCYVWLCVYWKVEHVSGDLLFRTDYLVSFGRWSVMPQLLSICLTWQLNLHLRSVSTYHCLKRPLWLWQKMVDQERFDSDAPSCGHHSSETVGALFLYVLEWVRNSRNKYNTVKSH